VPPHTCLARAFIPSRHHIHTDSTLQLAAAATTSLMIHHRPQLRHTPVQHEGVAKETRALLVRGRRSCNCILRAVVNQCQSAPSLPNAFDVNVIHSSITVIKH
jgi:hypothetical protein